MYLSILSNFCMVIQFSEQYGKHMLRRCSTLFLSAVRLHVYNSWQKNLTLHRCLVQQITKVDTMLWFEIKTKYFHVIALKPEPPQGIFTRLRYCLTSITRIHIWIPRRYKVYNYLIWIKNILWAGSYSISRIQILERNLSLKSIF